MPKPLQPGVRHHHGVGAQEERREGVLAAKVRCEILETRELRVQGPPQSTLRMRMAVLRID